MIRTHFFTFLILLFLLPCLISSRGCGDNDENKTELKQEIRQVVKQRFENAKNHGLKATGAVVGVWDYKREFNVQYAIGKADRSTEEALTKKHSFKIASVTKSMVTTLICQLIDEGKLSYNTPLSKFFPDLPKAEKVTIRMLGDMTSGYFDYLSDEEFLYEFDNTPHFTATPQELIQVGMSHVMQYEPGTDINYSNTNTVILGLIIEKITGRPLEKALQNSLFDPLDLQKTGAPPKGSYLPEPAAHSYHPDIGEDWTYKMDYSPEYACGNAYSILEEVKTLIEAISKGNLIKSDTHQKRFSKGKLLPDAPEDLTYHFGLIKYKSFLGHSGNTDYYLSEAYYSPEKETTIVVLSNSSAQGLTWYLFKDVLNVLFKE